jgi:SAM-dependent methyltransferase
MVPSDSERAERLYAEIYDVSVFDWPGELDFYGDLAGQSPTSSNGVLEVGCGTGRITIPLARRGVNVAGLDVSRAMLDIARQKSGSMKNIEWILGDMRSFDLGRIFDLVIVPGHSFQFMLTPGEQTGCLVSIRKHLAPNGRLVVHVDHQDVAWLSQAAGPKQGVVDLKVEVSHPETGHTIRTMRAWAYETSTQTATSRTIWEIVGQDGQILERLEREPVRLHCAFRFEMEHLFGLTGYQIDAVYGDFVGHPLRDDSEDMVWVAGRADRQSGC